jgi:pimeloyl-ACP methyl ester carboxylesterase
MLVIAVDHINTGDSSLHPCAGDLLPHVVAQANAIAFEQLRSRAQTGELAPGLAPFRRGPQIGVGHSMGAMLAIIQQSRHHSFDALAVLGYGTTGPIVSMNGAGDTYRASVEDVLQLAETGALDERLVDRADPQLRHHFYEKVADEVIEADDQTVTSLPGVTGLLSIVPFIVADHVSRLRCPVFIGLGERDSTPAHHDEAQADRSSRDITLFILKGSATATTRPTHVIGCGHVWPDGSGPLPPTTSLRTVHESPKMDRCRFCARKALSTDLRHELHDGRVSSSMILYVDTPLWDRPKAVASWDHYLGTGLSDSDAASIYASLARATDLTGMSPAYISVKHLGTMRDEGLLFCVVHRRCRDRRRGRDARCAKASSHHGVVGRVRHQRPRDSDGTVCLVARARRHGL